MPSNRLFFPTMVQRHLKKDSNLPKTSTDIFSSMESYQQDFEYPDRSLESSFNSIIASVHENLRETSLAKANAAREARERAAKSVVAVQATTEAAPTASMKLKKGTAKSDMNFRNSYKNDSKGVGLIGNLTQYNTRSISQIKASFEQKLQQRMRRNIGRPNDINNFTNQQRLKEVLRQKRLLEDILCEHEKIQRDRNSIAHEIETMKDYLSEIRGKLESSLKKLNKGPPKLKRPLNRPFADKIKRNASRIITRGNTTTGSKQSQTQSRVAIQRSLNKSL